MNFDRFHLILAIQQAKADNNMMIYAEPLSVLYCLLEQESINNMFLKTFYYFRKLSLNTKNYYKSIKID